MKILSLLFIPLILVSCLGKNKMQSQVISQADELGRNLIRSEWNAYLNKMAYFVYSNKEEREMLKENLLKEKSIANESSADLTRAATLKNTDIFEKDGYYQCIVKQVRYYTNNYTTYTADFYLLAISKDGENWKFADITNLPLKIVQAVFKEMHPDLNIVKDKAD